MLLTARIRAIPLLAGSDFLDVLLSPCPRRQEDFVTRLVRAIARASLHKHDCFAPAAVAHLYFSFPGKARTKQAHDAANSNADTAFEIRSNREKRCHCN